VVILEEMVAPWVVTVDTAGNSLATITVTAEAEVVLVVIAAAVVPVRLETLLVETLAALLELVAVVLVVPVLLILGVEELAFSEKVRAE
jgi:hypothetical protein